MSTRRFMYLFAVVVALLATASANADDFNPPDWRGQPGSTFQMWTFDTLQPTPTMSDNPYGSALILSGYSAWPDSGFIEAPEMVIFVPNRPSLDPFKLVRLQVTLRTDGPNDSMLLEKITTEPATQWEFIDFGMEDPSLTPGFLRGWADIIIRPNPYHEIFRMVSPDGSPLWWDQIVIDTWCPPVPEPMSMTLAGLGLFGVIGSRLRKR